jgi:hypothetical protein
MQAIGEIAPGLSVGNPESGKDRPGTGIAITAQVPRGAADEAGV